MSREESGEPVDVLRRVDAHAVGAPPQLDAGPGELAIAVARGGR
jgi:hypothetical protein